MADVIKTVGGGAGADYSTYASYYTNWLVPSGFAGDNEVAQIHGTSNETVLTTINTGNTASAQRIIIRDNGNRHEGKNAGDIDRIIQANTWAFDIIDAYVTIEDISFEKYNFNGNYGNFHTTGSGVVVGEIIVRRCMLIKLGADTAPSIDASSVVASQAVKVYRNTIHHNVNSNGIGISFGSNANSDCQFIQNTAWGSDVISAAGSQAIIKQNVVQFFNGGGSYSFGGSETRSKNLSEDGSGDAGFQNKVVVFVSEGSVNPDLHLDVTDTEARDKGDNLGSEFNLDIDKIIDTAYHLGSDGDLTDSTLPTITGHNPAKDSTGIALDTNIYFELDDDSSGVDSATITVTVEGGNAILNGSFQAGYTGTIVADGLGFNVTINPDADFSFEQVVNVVVDCDDLAGNSMVQDVYSFTIRGPDTSPPFGGVVSLPINRGKTSNLVTLKTTGWRDPDDRSLPLWYQFQVSKDINFSQDVITYPFQLSDELEVLLEPNVQYHARVRAADSAVI